jgi:magnesium-transporting ATPase (P-type)
MAFTTLVLAQLFNCFNARSDRASAFRGLFANLRLWGAVVLSVGLQVAVVHVGVLNEAFETTPLGSGEWLICVALASVVLWADEAKKVVGRWRSKRNKHA